MIPKFRIFIEDIQFMDYDVVGIDFKREHAIVDMGWDIEEIRRFKDVVLIQSTGLHDKNGKEIFEGDIIEIKHPFRNRTHIGEVFKNKYTYSVKDFYFSHYDIPGDAFSEGTEYMEVIGNIHQHPELLGEQT